MCKRRISARSTSSVSDIKNAYGEFAGTADLANTPACVASEFETRETLDELEYR